MLVHRNDRGDASADRDLRILLVSHPGGRPNALDRSHGHAIHEREVVNG